MPSEVKVREPAHARIAQWLDERLVWRRPVRAILDELVPGGARWAYAFGSALLGLLLIQVATGLLLALYYAPTPDTAYPSVKYIEEQVRFGRFVRGLHRWGASGMVVLAGAHLLQVGIWGAYKRPRELNWMTGVALLLLVLAFGFTGCLLPWDQRAYWATSVGVGIVGTVPVVGDLLARTLAGGTRIGALALTRFYWLHVLALPGLVALLLTVHLALFRRAGVTPRWDRSEPELRMLSEPFYPSQAFRDLLFFFLVFCALVVLALQLPASLAEPADPLGRNYVPRPEWYFLSLYQLLKYFEGRWEVVGTAVIPTLAVLFLLALPFLDRSPDRHPRRRLPFVGALLGGLGAVIVLTLLALLSD